MAEKQRLDMLLHQRGLAPSREKARAMIMAGEVMVDGRMVDKPGTRFNPDTALDVVIKSKPRFVSRGGDKLDAALDTFPIIVENTVCADVGASTGGFTDCLLQHGAAHIYAIDVGYGQLDYTLRQDARVTSIERTNARFLERLPQPIGLAVVDASFISLRLLLPVILGWLTPQADLVTLVKPQFEAGRKDVGKGGVVKNHDVHKRVLIEVLSVAAQIGLQPSGLIRSPLKGPAGNIEFLAWMRWGFPAPGADLGLLVNSAFLTSDE